MSFFLAEAAFLNVNGRTHGEIFSAGEIGRLVPHGMRRKVAVEPLHVSIDSAFYH